MSNPPLICPLESELKALLDGSLPEFKTDDLAAHLEGCAECRDSLDRMAAGDDWPEQVAKHLSRPGGESLTAARIAERWRKPAPETSPLSDGMERLEFLEPSNQPGVLGMLGPYEITETIGRGGFGLVLKGRDPRLNRIVAVKVLAPEWASNAMARKRFLREAQAAAAVRHDHVVTIYAVDEVAKLPYLVMEYVPGKSLQERLDEQGPLEVREILRIGRQIALGLSAAHAEGLIHRDIKPGNVLLEDGIQRVKITDFGLARAVDDVGMTQTGTVAGTPEYMSPEQAWGGPVDHRTDLFSLGGVLYAMCTGRSPFRAKSVLAVLKRVSEDQPRPIEEVNPEIPYGLIGIIEQLLAKDPQQRIDSAQEVAEILGAQLSALQNADTVHMPPEPMPENSMPPWLLYKLEKGPLGTWNWIAGCFHRANGWGRGLWPSLYGRKAVPSPQCDRRVRWQLVSLLGVGSALVLMCLMIGVLDRLEGRHRPPDPPVTPKMLDVTYREPQPPPWSPPLTATNELTLDIRDPKVEISIDGRLYPVEEAGKRLVRLGDGQHTLTVADEARGRFDQVEFSTPTSESYLRIDRGGILQSTGPTNVQVQWIPADASVNSLRFQGSEDRLLGLDGSGSGQVRVWPIGDADTVSANGGEIVLSPTSEHFVDHEMSVSMAGGSTALEGARAGAVSKDGAFLAIGGKFRESHEVRLFDIANRNPANWHRQMTVTQHSAAIQEIAFSPNGRLLLCTSEDRRDHSGRLLDGRTEIFRMDDLIATPLGVISRVPGRGSLSGDVVIAKFLPDNRRVLISDKNGNIEIWDTRPLRLESAFSANLFGSSSSPFGSLDFDASGRRALLGGAKEVYLFDLEQGNVLGKPSWLGGQALQLQEARFLPDNKNAALVVHDPNRNSNAELWICHVETGRITARLKLVEALRVGTNDIECHDLRFSPDGRRITSACLVKSNGFFSIAVVDWAVPEEAFASEIEPKTAPAQDRIQLVKTITTPGEVASIAFTPDGGQFITGMADAGSAIVRGFPNGEVIRSLEADDSQNAGRSESRIAVSPDGQVIADCRGNFLRLWNRETGEQQASVGLSDTFLFQRNGQTIDRVREIRSVAWSADGKHLVIACPKPVFPEGDQTKSLSTAYAFLVKMEAGKAEIIKRFPHPHDVNAAQFLDDSRIATACADGRVRIWDVQASTVSGRVAMAGQSVPDAKVEFQPKSGRPSSATTESDGRFTLGSQMPLHELRAGDKPVLCLDATNDGAYVAAGSADGSWHLWETRYGVRLNHWSEDSAIAGIRFLPQKDHLVTAHGDGHLVLWSLSERSEITRTRGTPSLTALAVAPDGRHVLTSSKEQSAVQIWQLPGRE